jgi:hypothetical protein
LFAALAALVGAPGCDAESDKDPVSPVAQVTGALTATLNAINGTYGAGCVARTGSWSLRVAGSVPLDNPALSVVRGNSACSLTITEFVASRTFAALPPLTMTTVYQSTASELRFGVGNNENYYANAKLSSTSFTSDFVVTALVSLDTTAIGAVVKSVPNAPPPATLHWFGDGASSQGGYDLTARYAPVEEVTLSSDWTALANGGNTSCGTRSGILWCWGDNAQG